MGWGTGRRSLSGAGGLGGRLGMQVTGMLIQGSEVLVDSGPIEF